MNFKQPVSVLVVIHTPRLDVLLLERAAHPGYWQSVTGSREDDEELRETAVREVAEETGLDATRYRLSDWKLVNRFEIYPRWRHRYAPGVTENTEHVFGLEVPEHVPIRLAPEEHVAHLWLPWREAAQKVFSWSNREAILGLPARVQRD
ncbi:MAG: dihydroneopterin triphosphate diphosphatase [Rhodocyclaceae bacterium]